MGWGSVVGCQTVDRVTDTWWDSRHMMGLQTVVGFKSCGGIPDTGGVPDRDGGV